MGNTDYYCTDCVTDVGIKAVAEGRADRKARGRLLWGWHMADICCSYSRNDSIL